jgi:hypothetical protein
MFKTPVLLIIFNRPNSTKKVFEQIRVAKPSKLYISADGPRMRVPNDNSNCHEVRQIINLIDWDCELHTQFHEKNLGCSLGPRSAFKWFFSSENEGIIIEDDCVPEPSFFQYCEELLVKYRYNNKIMLISGCNLGYTIRSNESYGFSRIPNMWGWATWKRSEEMIDYEMKEWRNRQGKLFSVYKAFRNSLFDFDLNWFKYWVNKFNLTTNTQELSWWDWQWIYFQTKNRMLSVFPSKNLVTNVGFNENATHTKEQENPAANLKSFNIEFPLHHPVKIKRNIDYEENHLKWTLFYHRRLPWHFYPRHYLKSFLKNPIYQKKKK